MTAEANVSVRTSEPPRLRALPRIRELYAHREILLNLVRKELKVKYTASVLGAVWSLLNPVVFLAVFTFVTKVTGSGLPSYPVYLLSGLLAWNLFSVSLSTGARSVIDNSNLVKKVAFPREILPLSAVGVALVDYVLQSAVLLLFIVATGYGFRPSGLLVLPLAVAALLVFTVAMSGWMAALNVRYRDVQHLINIGLLVWFWVTPIVYGSAMVQGQAEKVHVLGVSTFVLYLLNPLTPIVEGLHRALYGYVTPPGSNEAVLMQVSLGWVALVLGVVLVGSLLLLRLAWKVFFDLSGDFAEEL
jgi:ABC-2 type transport system permease protein